MDTKKTAFNDKEIKQLKALTVPDKVFQALNMFSMELSDKFPDHHTIPLWIAIEMAVVRAIQKHISELMDRIPEDEREDFSEGMAVLHMMTLPIAGTEISKLTQGKVNSHGHRGVTASTALGGDQTALALSMANFLAENSEFEGILKHARTRVGRSQDVGPQVRIMGEEDDTYDLLSKLVERLPEEARPELQARLELARLLNKVKQTLKGESAKKKDPDFSDS